MLKDTYDEPAGSPEEAASGLDEYIASVARLSRDLREAARTLSDTEAAYLVDVYYSMQKTRIRHELRTKALRKLGEPAAICGWMTDQSDVLEGQVRAALDVYSQNHRIGQHLRGVYGIGPVIAAGLLANLDIAKAPTCGHFWNFAGLNPGVTWDKKTKRPWNTSLKTVCYHAGECIAKLQNNSKSFYGGFFKQRKVELWTKNLAGGFAVDCSRILAERKFDKSTSAFKFMAGSYVGVAKDKAGFLVGVEPNRELGEVGLAMLPPAHVHARARRVTVKLMLSHLHQVWFEIVNQTTAPKPYAAAILEHGHNIAIPPEWEYGGLSISRGK